MGKKEGIFKIEIVEKHSWCCHINFNSCHQIQVEDNILKVCVINELENLGIGRNYQFTSIDCSPHSLLDIDLIFLFYGIDHFLTNQDRLRENIAVV